MMFKGPIQSIKGEEIKMASLKCPEIPILDSYVKNPGDNFWAKFPSKQIPEKAETRIKVEILEQYVKKTKKVFTCHQLLRANKCIKFLRYGAPSYQKKSLPSIWTKNSGSVEKNGPMMTDTIGAWIKKKIVSGPFTGPPMDNFRVNPLMAIIQHGKIRPILNVSEPAGRSFNDNIDKDKLEKVYMSSAKDFGHSLCKAGRSATFSKFDLSDAYKNLPAKPEDLRLQGFCWLERYFVEDRQIFGARSSVCNFDILGHTVLDIAVATSGINPELVHRRLDDVPVVGRADSRVCELFSETYKEICGNINLGLAPECPLREKAFLNQKEGKVLGITFHSEDLSWSLPQEKKERCLSKIKNAYESSELSLLDMQKLMGQLNDAGQLCPFIQLFKHPLNCDLAWLQNNEGKKTTLSGQSKKDLLVWSRMIHSADRLPIPLETSDPPLRFMQFSSDAAGVADKEENNGTGVGGVGLNEDGEIVHCFQEFWNDDMITTQKDSKGARYGSKTSTLEMVGLIIPFLSVPELLKDKHVLLTTDNISCVFGWENKAIKGDISASILVRTLAIVSVFLNCTVYVRHEKRKSSWESLLADRLTRKKTTVWQDRALLKSFKNQKVQKMFRDWLDNPSEDWSLVDRCMEIVIEKLSQ